MTREEFLEDRLRQLALQKLIEIIGEAAGRLSPDTAAIAPDVPWRDVVGMRHRLVHDYGRVNLDRLWDVYEDDLPSLIVAIEGMIPPEEIPGAA